MPGNSSHQPHSRHSQNHGGGHNATAAHTRRTGRRSSHKRCHFEEYHRDPQAASFTEYPHRAGGGSFAKGKGESADHLYTDFNASATGTRGFPSARAHQRSSINERPPWIRNRSHNALDLLDSPEEGAAPMHPAPRRVSPQSRPLVKGPTNANLQRNRPPTLFEVCSPDPSSAAAAPKHAPRAKKESAKTQQGSKRKFDAPFSDIASVLAAAAHLIIVENKERREQSMMSSVDSPAALGRRRPAGMGLRTGSAQDLTSPVSIGNLSTSGFLATSPDQFDPGSSTTRRFDVPALPPLEALPPSLAEVRQNTLNNNAAGANIAIPQPRSARRHTPTPRSRRQGKELTKQIEADILQLIVSVSENVKLGAAAPRIFVAAMVYLRRISLLGQGPTENLAVDERNYHRLCTVAIMMATKLYIEEHVRVNIKFSSATGIPVVELNKLEIEFLHLVDFNLIVHEADFDEMFEWIEDVGDKKGIPLSHRPINAADNVNANASLTSPLKLKQSASSTFLLGATSPNTVGADRSLTRTPPIGSLAVMGGAKLFTAKFVNDDPTPLASPKAADGKRRGGGGGGGFDADALTPIEMPSFPSSRDSISFFRGVDDVDEEEPLAAIDFPTFSPPPPPGGDSDDEEAIREISRPAQSLRTLSPLPKNVSQGTNVSQLTGLDTTSYLNELMAHSYSEYNDDEELFADEQQQQQHHRSHSNLGPARSTLSQAEAFGFSSQVTAVKHSATVPAALRGGGGLRLEDSDDEEQAPRAMRASAMDACPF